MVSENGGFMNKKEIAKNVIIQAGGISKTAELNNAGIANYEIVKLCEQGIIERVRHGYYQVARKSDVTDEQMIATFSQRESSVWNQHCFIMVITIIHHWFGQLLCLEH